jgi:putative phosphoesterase
MKLGLISDTHIPTQRRAMPADVARHFAGVDLILHAGDLVTMAVLETLREIAPVRAVRGNNDWSLPLPLTLVVEAAGFAIGVVHIRPEGVPAAEVFGRPVDIVVFGHTHRPADELVDGVRWLNPGSATSSRVEVAGRGFPFRRGAGTVARLTLEPGHADFELLPVTT